MPLTDYYLTQVRSWPQSGQQILAQFDETSVVVYQAFGPAIGQYAATHGRLGGHFRLTRTSWIKPNFLWMMYRSGWGTKEGQDHVLAIRIQRAVFDGFLACAVPTTFVPEVFVTHAAWQTALATSEVVLQWDPDHDPSGRKVERRALQLGLRGAALFRCAREAIVSIEDLSGFVHQQRLFATPERWHQLLTPREEVYPVKDSDVARRLGIQLAAFGA